MGCTKRRLPVWLAFAPCPRLLDIQDIEANGYRLMRLVHVPWRFMGGHRLAVRAYGLVVASGGVVGEGCLEALVGRATEYV